MIILVQMFFKVFIYLRILDIMFWIENHWLRLRFFLYSRLPSCKIIKIFSFYKAVVLSNIRHAS